MTLGLSMIVKNESEVLDRVLSAARIFADEIVIVDTGSTDGTPEIARRYTDKVFDYEWIDDFSAARNYAKSKVRSDYFMWLDADDIVPDASAKAIARLVRKLDESVDIVMLPYVLATDASGKPTYSFYRERIIKNRPDFFWRGRVHEAVVLHGKIVREKPCIYHAKPADRDNGSRNLDIYERMRADGEVFEPRERYYYARELYYNGKFEAAAQEFERFIAERDGFSVNKADACVMLGKCLQNSGDTESALAALFSSFRFGLPSGEACCEIAALYFARSDYASAAYWYERALHAKPDPASGAFVNADYYGFLPCLWLSVCYDRMRDYKKAFRYHCRARRLRPDHPSVIANQTYFEWHAQNQSEKQNIN